MAGLYAIVDPSLLAGRDPVRFAQSLLRGGCSRLQLRFKAGADAAHLSLARQLRTLCRESSVPFVVNDRPDIARLVGADGLHLGQDDLPVHAARELVGASVEIGTSTHTAAQVALARQASPDLLAFGPIFETASKANPDPVVGVGALAEVCRQVSGPVVAIGGLNADNIAVVRDAGAAYAAVIGALVSAEDPERMARALHRELGASP